jgi:hypothetical protein
VPQQRGLLHERPGEGNTNADPKQTEISMTEGGKHERNLLLAAAAMFIGHFAVGLAAKRAAPTVSLGTLFLSCQLADLVFPNLVLAGLERFSIVPGITVVTPLDFEWYPYSHSLLALIGWAVLSALVYRVIRRTPPFIALVTIAALVLSHWVLDVVSHRPDMPIGLGDGQRLGLGLWNSRAATLIVELVMFAIGSVIYTRTTKPIDRTGTFAFYGLILFLLVINAGNMFGPPPPSESAVTWSIQAVWLLVAWGYWIDRHRRRR